MRGTIAERERAGDWRRVADSLGVVVSAAKAALSVPWPVAPSPFSVVLLECARLLEHSRTEPVLADMAPSAPGHLVSAGQRARASLWRALRSDRDASFAKPVKLLLSAIAPSADRLAWCRPAKRREADGLWSWNSSYGIFLPASAGKGACIVQGPSLPQDLTPERQTGRRPVPGNRILEPSLEGVGLHESGYGRARQG